MNECYFKILETLKQLFVTVDLFRFIQTYRQILQTCPIPTGYQQIKYGALQNKGWQKMLKEGFAECFRVLNPGGFLIFKWNETDIKVSEILKLTPYKPIFGHISGKRANTHWICFMKENYNK